MKIEITEAANSPDAAIIMARLKEYNELNIYPYSHKDLVVSIKSDSGELLAGLVGFTNWEWLYVRLLWVDEASRGQGLASQLVQRAEQEALLRNCRASWIDTFSPRARKLYEGLGYKVFGQMEDCPPGSTRYFLKKSL